MATADIATDVPRPVTNAPNIMSRIAESPEIGLETQNVYQDRHGMVEHVFRARPLLPLPGQ